MFTHLRWDFVYQRPQHVLSRLAATRPVYVVEEPIFDASGPSWERHSPTTGVTVLRPGTPLHESGFTDAQLDAMRPLVAELADELGPCDVWFYTPLAVVLLDEFEARTVVYDCMDELSAFDHAPEALLDRERDLLERADLVFTGGPSLYRAKRNRHASVHCFPSSVDAAHFGQARPAAPVLEEPADQREIPHPRLGFFGVIDERLDRDLVGALAATHPEWQIVMVGPVVKIDPASLPQAPNLHWLGGRDYDDLPAYLAGWDVCLLPFARNRSTEFISPTKTLEYMAAERPIVSTPITDVAEPYGDIVYLGDTPEAFVSACEAALKASPRQRAANIDDMRAVLAKTSWDATVRRMAALLDASGERASGEASSSASGERASGERNTPEASTSSTLSSAQRAADAR